jgi:capsular exopolysaccharide synthesis family protein
VPDKATLTARKILSDAMSVSREGDTNVVSITLRANSPRLAHDLANTVARTYMDLRLEQRREAARAFSDWIDTRAEELRQQVTEAESAVTDYRLANGLLSDNEGASLSEQQLTELNAELIKSRADLAQKEAALRRARAVLADGGDIRSLPEVQTSEIVTELRNQLLALEQRERDLSATSSQNNPRLTQVRQQYAAMQAQLDDEISLLVETLGNEVETLQSRTELLTEALSQAGGASRIETQTSLGLRQLERVAEAYRERYQRYLDNAGLAAELQSFSTSGSQIVTSASIPLDPYAPATRVLVILSFIFGAVAAILIGLARDALDTKFRSARQVEDLLGVKVRALVPNLQPGEKIPEVVETQPQSLFSETISVLRFLLFSATARNGRAPVFLMTSAGAEEGKTSIAASLALSASQAGKKVLLVDADLRRAGLTTLYDMRGEVGFADILLGNGWEAPDIMARGVLDVLPAGIETDMPVHALESPRLAQFLELAREAYDLVVIDGPPTAHLADCTILSEQSDQLFFVIRWGRTERDDALRALQRLPREKIAGVVMNDCPPSEENGLGQTYRLYADVSEPKGKLVKLPKRPTTRLSLAETGTDRA